MVEAVVENRTTHIWSSSINPYKKEKLTSNGCRAMHMLHVYIFVKVHSASYKLSSETQMRGFQFI